MVQKIAGHHSGIRTANITIKLNISIEIYFKKSLGTLDALGTWLLNRVQDRQFKIK
jgi:hypothetical protein